MSIHCWADYHGHLQATYGDDWPEDVWSSYLAGNATCFLPDGHAQPHAWTPDEALAGAVSPQERA